MLQTQLPRIYELRRDVTRRGADGTFFESFDASLADNEIKLKAFQHTEMDLAALDDDAWGQFRAKVTPHFRKGTHTLRRWQFAWDILNEARAYRYLNEISCTDIRFVPESSKDRCKTPDLEASRDNSLVLCDVKTINISDHEATARRELSVRTIHASLNKRFFSKLRSSIASAESQIDNYAGSRCYNAIIYVVMNFDDIMNEHIDDYIDQIRSFPLELSYNKEAVIDVRPKFYWASPTSVSCHRFRTSKGGQWERLPDLS